MRRLEMEPIHADLVMECAACGHASRCRCRHDGMLAYTSACHLHGEQDCAEDCDCDCD